MTATVLSTSVETDPITRVPDVRDQPFGKQAEEQASVTAAIRKRVLRKEGVEIPVAAFQSYI